MSKERYKLPFAAYLFLINDNNEILLYRRKGGAFDGMYSVIAGHIEPGETATKTIIREAKEEAGIIVEPKDIEFVCFSHSNAGNKEFAQIFFTSKKWQGEIQNLEEDRCNELNFVDINNLPEDTIPYIKKAIECYQNRVGYFEFDWDK
jgi:8-oxo-dGTP diphosphatase